MPSNTNIERNIPGKKRGISTIKRSPFRLICQKGFATGVTKRSLHMISTMIPEIHVRNAR
jgi:hypothetical protein